MDTFIVKSEFNIIKRGLVIVVNLAENNYHDVYNKYLGSLFKGKEIVYKDKFYTINGIETQGVESRKVYQTAFLLKPVKDNRTILV